LQDWQYFHLITYFTKLEFTRQEVNRSKNLPEQKYQVEQDPSIIQISHKLKISFFIKNKENMY